ncbi:hypothetical protein ABPG75_001981 [Micractinium tetrahymenae]
MAGSGTGASVLATALFVALLAVSPVQGSPACSSPSCVYCNSLGTRCKECNAGYYVAWDGFCESAPIYPEDPSSPPPFGAAPPPQAGPIGAAQVYLDAAGVCKVCPLGYDKGPCAPQCYEWQYRDPATGKCRNCPGLCDRCRLENGAPRCTKCVPYNYARVWAEEPLFPVYRNRQGACTACQKHFYARGCRACDQDGNCSKCAPGYVLVDGACKPCKDRLCAQCSPSSLDTCQRCQAVYSEPYGDSDAPIYRDRQGSKLHGPLCVECNNGSRCTKCLPFVSKGNFSTTTYLSSTGQCKLCPQGCEACRTDGSCRACAAGYRAMGKQCVKCQDPAQYYTTCNYCNEGPGGPMPSSVTTPTHVENGRCVQNPPGCAFWDSSLGGCSGCQNGWVQVGKACKRCADPLCAQCDARTQQKCWSCQYVAMFDDRGKPLSTVYRGADGRCHECAIKGCLECRADGKCKECAEGYLLIQGKCIL